MTAFRISYKYNPTVDKWEEAKAMPAPRTALVANFINGILYANGGLDDAHNARAAQTRAADPKSDTWTERLQCQLQGII